MKLAITLFHYFPYGGLERDMLAVVRACQQRGHEVTIYTREWQGDIPADLAVVLLPTSGISNHQRAKIFAARCAQAIPVDSDVIIGFNKMPGLDVYFAADTCFAQKVYEERNWFYRWSSRSRAFLTMERAVFDASGNTEILLISPAQKLAFQHYYQTPDSRLHLLPPGVKRDRVMPPDYDHQRQQVRMSMGVSDDHYVMLMIGSDFKRKGLARSLRALASLPLELKARCQLWVAGQDDAAPYLRLAQQLGVAEHLVILGARDDIPSLLWSADVLLHPAHSEAAGAVLLEAMVAGLPVIASDVCGYAHYINTWQMGKVLSSDDIDTQLAAAIIDIAAQDSDEWRAHAHKFIEQADTFDMHEKIVAIIEAMGTKSLGKSNHSDL
ncbi:glycosyltransferase family 4 protein [Cellvibrio sp. NN19]|uniref:glycosyltransferase family 4 protein n=1 Tax=Cellvibrio chitinivorans TaxID=3102792 RepID=UPI002B4129D6|nr:glycosyltransferase family 4 protein [Cellvibrio sp. NN19]